MTSLPGSIDRQTPYPVLVVGSGAREHALVWALARSPSVSEVWAAPGNPGIASLAGIVDLPVTDVAAITDWAEGQEVGLVVVGPEAPLALGLVDRLQERGIPVFGPTRAAAELEWSKRFAKEFMLRHAIPTASFAAFSDLEDALAFIRTARFPLVVKADGLAAGKGVFVCATVDEAASAAEAILVDRAFGAAGDELIVEECLAGEEVSVIALVDGKRIALLPLARDYKRLGDCDEGPNTGGMGSYAPVTDLDPGLVATIRATVLEPAVAGMREEGRPYQGALYAGLMLTPNGPRVLEFNCRFGDPETQVIVPLLRGDLAALLMRCAQGTLQSDAIAVEPGAAVCIVAAAAGYPDHPRAGDAIAGIAEAGQAGALVFHAGTALRAGELVTSGGRVLSVVAAGADSAAARARAYAAVEHVSFSGMQVRRDIASAAVLQQA